MKTLLITGALCSVIGATVGWMSASNHYEAKKLKELAAYVKALEEANQRVAHYQSISEEYYADYQDAINREPTVVTERVFVRAHCKTDASANSSRKLGNAATNERVELHAETVRSATAVTDQAERDVLTCRAALHSLQDKIQAHNELQRR